MKCVRCKRPLTAAAQTIQTQHGLAAVGPVCARIMGLTSEAQATSAPPEAPRRRRRSRKPSTGQLPLDLQNNV